MVAVDRLVADGPDVAQRGLEPHHPLEVLVARDAQRLPAACFGDVDHRSSNRRVVVVGAQPKRRFREGDP